MHELLEFRARVEEDRLEARYVADRRRSVEKRLAPLRRLPWYQAAAKRAMLRLRSGPWAESLGLAVPKRRLSGRGLFLAVVGADGSGKSRLSRDLETWLGGMIQVGHLYFGQPKTGVAFKLLNKPGSLARGRERPGILDRVAEYTDSLKWVYLARKRRDMAGSARQAAAEGVIVIAERFPLPEFFTMPTPMDGPRLQPSRLLARSEMRMYQAMARPDLVLVLDADVSTLRARKVDLTVDEHQEKVAAVRVLAATPARRILDASRPYEEVLLQAKREIWEAVLAGR
jgi:thymidylate kinase